MTDQGLLTRFFELWTSKEAYGKCMGFGMQMKQNSNANTTHVRHMMNFVDDGYGAVLRCEVDVDKNCWLKKEETCYRIGVL